MLPTGHLAVGYLTSRFSLVALSGIFTQTAEPKYLWAGVAASVLPDLDVLYFFAKHRILTSGTHNGTNHRMFRSHAPLVHSLLAVVAWTLAKALGSESAELYALMYLVGTMTHFVFDSFFYGIAWLWPFSDRLFAVQSAGVDLSIQSSGTLDFWKKFFRAYSKLAVFYLELIFIAVALFVYLNY